MKSVIRNTLSNTDASLKAEAILHEQLALHRLRRIERRSRLKWFRKLAVGAHALLNAIGGLRAQGELVIHLEPGRPAVPFEDETRSRLRSR